MPKITKNEIIWDSEDWLAGLHPQEGRGKEILFNGISSSDSFNPFIRLGYASVGENAENSDNSSLVDGVIKSIKIDETFNEAYGVGGTKLYQIATTSGNISSDANFPRVISGTGVEMEDIVKYTINGVDYMFYSWNDNTDGDVGRLLLSGPTFDDNYMSTVPTGAAVLDKDNSHPLVIGDDDFLYIGDGRNLHRYDGPTDTLIENAFVLPSGYIIRSFAKFDNETLVIFADTSKTGTTPKGKIQAFFWNYLDEDPYRRFVVTGTKAGGAIEYKGTIAVFSSGFSADPSTSARSIHFSIFNGNRFKKIRSIKFSSDGDPPTTGGVYVFGDYLLANFDGNIYSFGSPFEEIDAGYIPVAALGSTSPGAVTILSGSIILCSSGVTTNGGMQRLTGLGIGTTSTTFADPGFPIGFVGKIRAVRVEFGGTFSEGRTLSFILTNRKSEESFVYDGLDSITNDRVVDERRSDTSDNPFIDFQALQLTLRWLSGEGSSDAALIRRIVVEYEPKKIDK